ncbi:MAG: glycogen synthase [Verrucomicrobiaceae bacterium]|nr:MAG: glycogen synthase [Verrucomicrobiaceae bacterium]
MPHFRSMYEPGPNGHSRRLHLCQDREFWHRRSVYEGCQHANLRGALAFQRDVIHYVMPRLRPDLVHCHDWMTGLVPAAARTMGIPSLFTLHNQHDECVSLGQIEDRGIDAGGFWQNLYFKNYPGGYESAHHNNSVSMLASGILAANEMNTVSRTFLGELAGGGGSIPWEVTDAVRAKLNCSRAHGIINSPPATISPEHDPNIAECYDSTNHVQGKLASKRALQQRLGLETDDEAPILFWPSRLDPRQKGCQLLADILYRLVSDYWALGLQVVFVADGPYHDVFKNIASFHQMSHRIAVCGFSEGISRLGYAGSDYILMPSTYEPCGLAQMVGLRYGSLPIVHATGGLRDTVTHLDPRWGTGNGFVFEHHDAQGLRWAIDEAMRFHMRPAGEREANVSRIMKDACASYSPESMVANYVEIYKRLLQLQ